MFLEEKSKFAGVSVDPFSLEALVAWLRTKDANESYDYWDYANCAMCQFAKNAGYKFSGSERGYKKVAVIMRTALGFPPDRLSCQKPHTFGALLARAEALL